MLFQRFRRFSLHSSRYFRPNSIFIYFLSLFDFIPVIHNLFALFLQSSSMLFFALMMITMVSLYITRRRHQDTCIFTSRRVYITKRCVFSPMRMSKQSIWIKTISFSLFLSLHFTSDILSYGLGTLYFYFNSWPSLPSPTTASIPTSHDHKVFIYFTSIAVYIYIK